jgi:hypothetical protein
MIGVENPLIDTLLHELIIKNRQVNFVDLYGKGIKGENILNVQNLLSEQGYITKVPNSIGVTFIISNSGRKLFYDRLIYKVLKILKHQTEFFKISELIGELTIADADGDLAECLEDELICNDWVFNTNYSGVKINDKGLSYLRRVKFGLENSEKINYTERVTQNKFSSQEQEETVSKINEVLERFNKLDAGQEVLFEEINSLKDYFDLDKKTFVQLIKGKLIELTADKIIEFTAADIIFNTITESINGGHFILPQ